jgi:hypothetical protein
VTGTLGRGDSPGQWRFDEDAVAEVRGTVGGEVLLDPGDPLGGRIVISVIRGITGGSRFVLHASFVLTGAPAPLRYRRTLQSRFVPTTIR